MDSYDEENNEYIKEEIMDEPELELDLDLEERFGVKNEKKTKGSEEDGEMENYDDIVDDNDDVVCKKEISDEQNLKRKVNNENEPPKSRLFIICGKETNQSDVESIFVQEMGQDVVEYVKIIVDRNTGETKGIGYVKMINASSAALAIERLDGFKINDGVFLKVRIAEEKGGPTSGGGGYFKGGTRGGGGPFVDSDPADVPERSRLFVLCPKDMNDDEIKEFFVGYDDFEWFKLNRDHNTNLSKGCGFAKFSRAYSAALCMEELNRSQGKIKAMIADPKRNHSLNVNNSNPLLPYGRRNVNVPPRFGSQYPPPIFDNHQRLIFTCDPSTSREALESILSRYNYFEYCDSRGDGVFIASFCDIETASLVKAQLDGFQYPPGKFMKVSYPPPPVFAGHPNSNPNNHNFKKFQPHHPPPIGRDRDRYYPDGSRLFIKLVRHVDDATLHDVFSRFSGLEYVKLLKPDKAYGYAKFNNSHSADYVLSTLDGSDIGGGNILRIQVAQPPPVGPSYKRQRI